MSISEKAAYHLEAQPSAVLQGEEKERIHETIGEYIGFSLEEEEGVEWVNFEYYPDDGFPRFSNTAHFFARDCNIPVLEAAKPKERVALIKGWEAQKIGLNGEKRCPIAVALVGGVIIFQVKGFNYNAYRAREAARIQRLETERKLGVRLKENN
jgi:hypothetical protein